MKTNISISIVLALCTSCLLSQELKFEPYKFQNKAGETVNAQLGSFEVPENRNNPNSRSITLNFVRFKSLNPNPKAPIVYLAGGPGGSGISTAKGKRFELFMKLREVADVIALDQRGTGLSEDIPRCNSNFKMNLSEPGTLDTYVQVMQNSSKQCLDFWKEKGIDFNGYNTMENAKDIDDLRQALGVEKINLWGISYGSHLGFAYTKLFGEHVENLVLASLEGLDETIKLPKNNESFLRRVDGLLQKDSIAFSKYGPLPKLMQSVFDTLRSKPIQTMYFDRRSEKKIEVGISDFDLKLVTSYFLTKNPEDISTLPLIYHEVLSGKSNRLAGMVAGIKQYASRVRLMPLVADVASGVSAQRRKSIVEQAKTAMLSGTTNFPYPEFGEGLGIVDLGADYRKPFKSNVRALFLSGTLDGRTYIESARAISKDFKNSRHLVIDGAGHDLFLASPNIIEIIQSFFSGKEVQSQTIRLDVPKFK